MTHFSFKWCIYIYKYILTRKKCDLSNPSVLPLQKLCDYDWKELFCNYTTFIWKINEGQKIITAIVQRGYQLYHIRCEVSPRLTKKIVWRGVLAHTAIPNRFTGWEQVFPEMKTGFSLWELAHSSLWAIQGLGLQCSERRNTHFGILLLFRLTLPAWDQYFSIILKDCYRDYARTYLQPHYGKGVFGNVYLSAGQH